LFARKWKFFHEDSSEIDFDTVPDYRNNRREGNLIELLTLSEIVHEIMSSNDNSSITYHDDGSKKQGVGSFSGLTTLFENSVVRDHLQYAEANRDYLRPPGTHRGQPQHLEATLYTSRPPMTPQGNLRPPMTYRSPTQPNLA
jgi:hypothetical protein